MIKPDMTHVNTLEEFYKEITTQQAGAHGEEYIQHHKALIKCIEDGCENIKELGVCQGGTLAAMLMQKPKKLIGIDIAERYFQPYKNLFDSYAKENNLDFKFIIGDSTDKNLVSECDLLHIDSLHKPEHLMKELTLHAPHVKKYIVFHDTANFGGSKGLLSAIAKYITEVEQEWQIVDHYIQRVGYTVIKRVKRLEYIDKANQT